MDDATASALLWSCLQALTRTRFETLIRAYGNLTEALRHLDGELLKGLGCRPQTVEAILGRLDKYDADEQAALLERSQAKLITLADDTYPDALKDIPDAPPFLYVRGNLDVLAFPCVSIVGTREMTSYGRRATQDFTRAITWAGMTTVSGLARGIDTVVAEETLAQNGRTVAVLGQGLLTLTPGPDALASRIVAHGGAVLSEFPLACPADAFTFPMRNRIIAGASMATVVIEAPESSGALITARLAFEYNREVFAVPGAIYDENAIGCHALLHAQQAKIATDPRHVLEELGVVVFADDEKTSTTYAPTTPDETVLINALTGMPQNLDALMERSGLSASSLTAILTVLELHGAARNLGNGQWIRG